MYSIEGFEYALKYFAKEKLIFGKIPDEGRVVALPLNSLIKVLCINATDSNDLEYTLLYPHITSCIEKDHIDFPLTNVKELLSWIDEFIISHEGKIKVCCFKDVEYYLLPLKGVRARTKGYFFGIKNGILVFLISLGFKVSNDTEFSVNIVDNKIILEYVYSKKSYELTIDLDSYSLELRDKN